jgi:HEAT repeat protein
VEALTSVDPGTRFDALRAIQAQPHAALAFGIYKGRDVIDILLAQAGFAEGTMEWMSWVGALGSFRDPRVTDFFVHTIATTESPQLIFSAARYLAEDDPATLWVRLLPSLLQNENPIRARAVATFIEQCLSLPAAARLRAALLSEVEGALVPVLDQRNTALWLAELAGPFWREAQRELKTQGEPAWIALAITWSRLTENTRLWLLRWGAEEFPGMVVGMVPDALRNDSDAVRIEALRALAALQESGVPEFIATMAAGLLDDPDPKIREAAVQAAPKWLDWRAFLLRETIPSVRRACVPQLLRSEGDKAIPDLIALLRSDDWQLRTVSAQALVQLGASGAEAVKPLVHDQDQRVRVAAVRVLLDLQQDEWLQEELLSSLP